MADEAREVSREEAQKLIEDGAQLVDVRVDHEWGAGHIAGASTCHSPSWRSERKSSIRSARSSSTAAAGLARPWRPKRLPRPASMRRS